MKKITIITVMFFMGMIAYAEDKGDLSRNIKTPLNVDAIIGQVSYHPLNIAQANYYHSDERINAESQNISHFGEFLIDTNVVYGPNPDLQNFPSVAFDGTNYLVVWTNYPTGRYDMYDIYGARVSQTGTLLDLIAIPISVAENDQCYPSVAFDGANYLVVWLDQRNYDSSENDIYGARVSPSGIVLDPSGIPISTAEENQESPSVNFDGTNYLVVWEDERNGHDDIYGARVSPSGTVHDSAGIAISTAIYGQYQPKVAFDDTNYFIVWQDYRNGNDDIYGARLNQAGDVLDPNGIAISTASEYQISPSVVFSNTNYLVVWEDWRNASRTDIYGARVSPAGTVLDTSGIPISIADGSQSNPSVTFDGTNYLVVWKSDNIWGARVSPSGTVLDPSGITISTPEHEKNHPSVAFDGANYLVVWADVCLDEPPYPVDIYGALINKSGIVLNPRIAISTTVSSQVFPAVAFDSTNYLVVWTDCRNGPSSNIYSARVSPSGIVLDPSGIPVSTAEGNQENPSVAFDGTNYLVVWQDTRNGSAYDIFGASVDPDGIVTDLFVISTQSEDQTSPCVVHGTEEQMFVTYSGWTDSINTHPASTMRIWGNLSPFLAIEETQSNRLKTNNLYLQVYPNPFTHTIEIKYYIGQFASDGAKNVELKIYNVIGRLVKKFSVPRAYPSAFSSIVWDGRDKNTKKVSSGIYFVKLQAGNYNVTKKVLLMR
jgi:hypothetical protein